MDAIDPTNRPPDRYGYGDAGHPFDPDRTGRCRKRTNGYCDGTRADSMHEPRWFDKSPRKEVPA